VEFSELTERDRSSIERFIEGFKDNENTVNGH